MTEQKHDLVTQVEAIMRDHVRDYPAIVGARPDRCAACEWEGTNHIGHVAEQIVAALGPGEGA